MPEDFFRKDPVVKVLNARDATIRSLAQTCAEYEQSIRNYEQWLAEAHQHLRDSTQNLEGSRLRIREAEALINQLRNQRWTTFVHNWWRSRILSFRARIFAGRHARIGSRQRMEPNDPPKKSHFPDISLSDSRAA